MESSCWINLKLDQWFFSSVRFRELDKIPLWDSSCLSGLKAHIPPGVASPLPSRCKYSCILPFYNVLHMDLLVYDGWEIVTILHSLSYFLCSINLQLLNLFLSLRLHKLLCVIFKMDECIRVRGLQFLWPFSWTRAFCTPVAGVTHHAWNIS